MLKPLSPLTRENHDLLTWRAQELVVACERVDALPLLLAHLERLNLPEHWNRVFGPQNNDGWVITIWLAALLHNTEHLPEQLDQWAVNHRFTIERFIGHPFDPQRFATQQLAKLVLHLNDAAQWYAFEEQVYGEMRNLGFEPEPLNLLHEALAQAQLAREQLQKRLDQACEELDALNHRRRGKFTNVAELYEAAQAVLAEQQLSDLIRVQCNEQVSSRNVRRYRGRPHVVRVAREVSLTTEIDTTAVNVAAWRAGWWTYAATMPHRVLPTARTLLAYRSAAIIERGEFLRLDSDTLPNLMFDNSFSLGLARLLTIGVQALALLDALAARNVATETAPPQAEQLLTALREITLTTCYLNGQRYTYLTPLTSAQIWLLRTVDLAPEIYSRLVEVAV
jgi:hypothetical protein